MAVERVEANYKKLPIIQQIFAYGNSMESVLVAVVVPEEPLLIDAAKKQGINFTNYPELLAKPETKSMLLKQMDAVAKESKMKVSLLLWENLRCIALDCGLHIDCRQDF